MNQKDSKTSYILNYLCLGFVKFRNMTTKYIFHLKQNFNTHF